MNRKSTAQHPQPTSRGSASTNARTADALLVRLKRRIVIAGSLCVFSLIVAAYVGADWYYGLPPDAEAKFVGRQSCVQCHQSQHSAWEGSHHDLAMDLATEKTVLGNFNNAELMHHGTQSRMFKRDGKFFVNTEGPDGELADFEVKYVFGVDPLQQYMVEFDRTRAMNCTGPGWRSGGTTCARTATRRICKRTMT
jgi:hypothetical protein